MKKIFTVLFALFFLVSFSFSQNSGDTATYVRKPAIAISFFFNDYTTAQRIRASSLSSVLANKQKVKLKDRDPGLAIGYYKGLKEHLDLAVTLSGSFVEYEIEGRTAQERFLLEADASINLKLLTEKYWLTPYASVGAGMSKYGGYFGAFIPVGVGLKLNILDEAHIFYNTQYRIPVTTETAAYHFYQGIGIAGTIGK